MAKPMHARSSIARRAPLTRRAMRVRRVVAWAIVAMGITAAANAFEGADPADPASAFEATLERPIPIGAFCPAPPDGAFGQASTFGLSVAFVWALSRHRRRSDRG